MNDSPKARTATALRACVVALALLLAACSSSKIVDQYIQEGSVEQLYNAAMDSLVEEDYRTASQLFDEVERQHPYSIWATKAQLMSAYAHYQADNYDDAVVGLDRFVQLHPSNPDVPYAYYLKALSYYEQIVDVERDQLATRRALDSLEEVVRRFPDTDYARDARLKVDLTHDHLAGKEMAIGRFYLRRNNLLAAVNRFKTVVDDYQTTSHVPEALHRLTEAYTALGLVNEARRVAAVLGHNYPGSEWYSDTYALVEGVQVASAVDTDGDSGGILSRTMSGIGSVFRPSYRIPRIDEDLIARSRARAAEEAERMAAVAARPAAEDRTAEAPERAPAEPARPAAEPDPLAAKRAELIEELRAVQQAAGPEQAEPAPRAVEQRPLPPRMALGAPLAVPGGPPGDRPRPDTAGPASRDAAPAGSTQPSAAPARTESSAAPDETGRPGPAAETTTAALPRAEEPRSARAMPAMAPPPSAERELAKRRLEDSQASLIAWRAYEDAAEASEERERAEGQRKLADSAVAFWEAKLAVLDATDEADRQRAQRTLAARSVDYWKAIEESASDERARESAADKRRTAERAVAFWDAGGRPPSEPGWLGRTLQSIF